MLLGRDKSVKPLSSSPMGTSLTDPVWYACYGSNCSLARFSAYLVGGSAPGTTYVHPGARDPSPPQDAGPVVFASQICFTGHAESWGGAPAFLEHRPAERGAWGKRYLIGAGQFADIFDQENRRAPGTSELPDLASLHPGALVDQGAGPYGTLVVLDPVEGVPCLSFTSPTPPEQQTPAAPSASYLRTIAQGLYETHRVSPQELVDHLLRAPGVTPAWDQESIRALLGAVAN
jgi:hypothetical protein